MQTFEGDEVRVGDIIYTVVSAPAHGKRGGYCHASAYRVEPTKDGKKLKLVHAWTGDDFTSIAKAWAQAKSKADNPKPTMMGGRRILSNKGGMPRLENRDGN